MDKKVAERMNWMIGILPEPFKAEFTNDVLIDEDTYDMKTLEKVFTYYLQDCWAELPESVKDIIEEEYLIISLSS